jgi:ADP-ribose pyrophosphatase
MRRRWKSLSKHYLHRAQTPDEISFVRERVRLPSGNEFDYFYVDCPYEVVFVVIEDAAGDICLLNQFRHLAQDEVIEIPAGSPDPGQTLEDGARQEAEEEAGVKIAEIEHIGEFYASIGITNQKNHAFYARAVEFIGERPSESEIIKSKWLPKEQVKEMLQRNEIKNAGAALALLTTAMNKGWLS